MVDDSFLLGDYIEDVRTLSNDFFNDLSEWELNFLDDLDARYRKDDHYLLSENQREIILKLTDKHL